MDSNNLRTGQGQVQIPAGEVIGGEAVAAAAVGLDGSDWRNHLEADSRQRIVNKIMETLKRHIPLTGQEGLQELKNIAVGLEEKIYTAATGQSDYLRKISLKMLTMDSKSQNSTPTNNKNPQDPGTRRSKRQKRGVPEPASSSEDPPSPSDKASVKVQLAHLRGVVRKEAHQNACFRSSMDTMMRRFAVKIGVDHDDIMPLFTMPPPLDLPITQPPRDETESNSDA
ncbi:hypothetical protein ACP275_06G141600 [Erythranthe tilingii]